MSEWADYEARVDAGGGAARQARQRRLGRGTARERVAALLDAESFVETGRYRRVGHGTPGDGVVTGFGRVDGVAIAVVAHDPTVERGALGRVGAEKVAEVLQQALERRLPVVTLADSDGARVREGIDGVLGNGLLLEWTARLSGEVPQITLVCGLCVGAAAYAAAIGDFVGMVRDQAFLFITGPAVTRAATGQDVAIEELGGPSLHFTRTGTCHAVLDDEAAGIAWVKALLGRTVDRAPADPVRRAVPELETLIPTDEQRPYDVRPVLRALFDADSFLVVGEGFAPNLVTGLARLGGRSVGVLASQPAVLAGCLDVASSQKGARFLAALRALALPVITFVDVPGFLPGLAQEAGGVLPFGAELIQAYARHRRPRVAVVLRKAYGAGNVLSYPADLRLGLPTARVGAMGVQAALAVELGPEPTGPEWASRRAAFLAEHDSARPAAEAGFLTHIVAPTELRAALHRHLGALDGR